MKSTDLKKISYRLLLVAAVFFMGIGYASVNSTNMKIQGSASAVLPTEAMLCRLGVVLTKRRRLTCIQELCSIVK